MYQNEREIEILKVLAEENYVTVKSLSDRLFTSQSSIRRDLQTLEGQGLIRRSYGGAELSKSASGILPFSTRAHRNIAAKKSMAQKAAALVNKGDMVFLDQSSSSYYVAAELRKIPGITVVTNNVEILTLLSQTDLQVISTGGHLSRSNRNCLLGTDAQQLFSQIHADILFFSAKAMTPDGTVYDCDREEICLRHQMLASADKRVFLCGSDKYGQTSGYKQCTADDLHYIITEKPDRELFAPLGPHLEKLL